MLRFTLVCLGSFLLYSILRRRSSWTGNEYVLEFDVAAASIWAILDGALLPRLAFWETIWDRYGGNLQVPYSHPSVFLKVGILLRTREYATGHSRCDTSR